MQLVLEPKINVLVYFSSELYVVNLKKLKHA